MNPFAAKQEYKQMADEQVKDNVAEDSEAADEQNSIVNIVAIEDCGTLKKKIKVEIPEEQITSKLDENYGEMAKSAPVPGFRIGHAPRKLIEKRFGKDIREQVRIDLLSKSIGEAIEKSELKTLGEPDIKVDEIELPDSGAMNFEFEVEVQPAFDLPGVEGIALTEHEVNITDKDVEQELDKLAWQRANLKEMEEGASTEKNDHIEVDYSLEVGDEAPVKKHDTPIDLRPVPIEGIMFENLGDELAGLKIGDSKEVETEVSDSHTNEAWRGKKAKLKVTIKKIFRWIKPEMTDELVKLMGYDSLKECKDALKTELESQKGQQARKDLREQVKTYLLDNTKIDLPEGISERHVAQSVSRRIMELQRMGIPPAFISEKLDEIKSSTKDVAIKDLKLSFILNEIADKYEIEVSDEEANGIIASIASQSGRRPERFREDMMRDGRYQNLLASMREERTVEKLLDMAKIEKKDEKKKPESDDKDKK